MVCCMYVTIFKPQKTCAFFIRCAATALRWPARSVGTGFIVLMEGARAGPGVASSSSSSSYFSTIRLWPHQKRGSGERECLNDLRSFSSLGARFLALVSSTAVWPPSLVIMYQSFSFFLSLPRFWWGWSLSLQHELNLLKSNYSRYSSWLTESSQHYPHSPSSSSGSLHIRWRLRVCTYVNTKHR